MKFYQITDIEFDFDYEDLTDEEKNEIISESKKCLWDVPNPDDFEETIYRNMGYEVKSLEYITK
jgi:hypothetical protein